MADDAVLEPVREETETDPWGPWRSRIAAGRRRRDDLVQAWQENVDRRRGATDETATPSTRVSINLDWSLTKAKLAQLYSQTPEVRLTPRYDAFKPMLQTFARELNTTIDDASVGSTIEEALSDVINASGIGGAIVYCEKRTEPREVPILDPAVLPPEMQLAVMRGAAQIPTEVVEHTTDVQYLVERLSPADLLIPSDFTGSNYDKARWLGRDGRLTWTQALTELGLDPATKDDVLGGDTRANGSTNSLNTDTTKFRDTEVVTFAEVFYWRHFYHRDETNFSALQRLVFVDGLDDPVIDEPYRVQQRMPDGRMAGVLKNPIRILTLTYISDDSFPPSDSSVGRFQVDELEASRDAMVQQRKHSIPIRWFNTGLVSGNARTLLEKGTFQGFVPINGTGDRALGEVARATFPAERFEFDRVIKSDLTEMWQVGSNQAGAFASGERSAREAGIIEKNFQRRVGQEQDKVGKFFLGIAEVLAGHLAIYGQFDMPDELGEHRALLGNAFLYSIRIDATVRATAEDRIDQLMRFLNMTAQSGYVNPKPIIEEIAELSNLDPAKVIEDPKPKPPEPVKVSVSKAEDLMNPMFLATLMRTQQAPTPDDVQAALAMLQMVLAGPNAQAFMPPASTSPEGAPQEALPPGAPPLASPEWEAAPRIDRRTEDGGA